MFSLMTIGNPSLYLRIFPCPTPGRRLSPHPAFHHANPHDLCLFLHFHYRSFKGRDTTLTCIKVGYDFPTNGSMPAIGSPLQAFLVPICLSAFLNKQKYIFTRRCFLWTCVKYKKQNCFDCEVFHSGGFTPPSHAPDKPGQHISVLRNSRSFNSEIRQYFIHTHHR